MREVLAPESAYAKLEQQRGDPMKGILAQMAVERGLYKPGTDAYQRAGIEVKRGFDPLRYKKYASTKEEITEMKSAYDKYAEDKKVHEENMANYEDLKAKYAKDLVKYDKYVEDLSKYDVDLAKFE